MDTEHSEYWYAHADERADAYADLAAESGWAACSECGKWQPRERMDEYEGYLYCEKCTCSYERPFLGVDGSPEELIPYDPAWDEHDRNCRCEYCEGQPPD